MGDPIEAYAALRLSPALWTDQDVAELVWATPQGYRSILATLSRLCMNSSALTWFEPSDGPFLWMWADRGVDAELINPAMYRVVDVPALLAALHPKSSGTFTMEIEDAQIPENRGPWRVSYAPDGVSVERSRAGELKMHIRHFSQALLGEPDFSALLRLGEVSATNERSLKAAADLLPPRPTYCIDFF